MRTKTWMVRVGALACAGALLTGCSTDGSADGEPVAKSGGDNAAVDPAGLDTGSYPTDPAPEYGRAADDTILDVETQRLAEFTVAPFEVDPGLSKVGMPTMGLRSSANIGVIINGGAPDIAKKHDFLYGYSTTASTPVPTVTDPSRSIVHVVMRFATAEGATAAAREIHNDLITVDSDDTGLDKPETIAILPNTLVSTSEHNFNAGPEVSVNAFTAHGTYVLYTYASAPADQKDWTATAVAKALDLQGPLIDQFPATPTKEQRGDKPAELPVMDQDKILIYAIPEEDDESQLGNDMAAYGPRGMAHRSTNPPLTYRVLTEAGSKNNAVYKTTVYRASDDEGAQKIMNEFHNDLTSQGYTEAPSPQGLPDARCVTKDTVQGTQDYCMIANGRYVGEASGLDNKKDVDQQISAQYLILAKADQNAK
ncbi:hypothetical protein [Rhodococcus sp. 1168]|uniref:DUF7373 family lipoprotein n=1 Tax=Rhodococcus sp. 1168 TaxID=2018041 RepID=UPI0020CAC0EA|nr:hypothetical protein [Rhodococcus sp. 1168]